MFFYKIRLVVLIILLYEEKEKISLKRRPTHL